MTTVAICCAYCGALRELPLNRVRRARSSGVPLYCGRACAGLSRRLPIPKTEQQKKREKQQYDAARRAARRDELCAAKREYYRANRERILAAQAPYRKANMHRHVEYCRRPEYKAWKVEYDRRYKARESFGDYADAALLLTDIETEIAAQATRYEIYQANGTINKAQTRRRAL